VDRDAAGAKDRIRVEAMAKAIRDLAGAAR
jgi:hypothetical protein